MSTYFCPDCQKDVEEKDVVRYAEKYAHPVTVYKQLLSKYGIPDGPLVPDPSKALWHEVTKKEA